MIDRQTWLILVERLEQIRRAREDLQPPKVKLVYDKNDQATVVAA